MKLYHVSKIPNLTVLQPHVSTHGKAYVYATPNVECSLFFGGNMSFGDFDGIYGVDNNIAYFYEAYKGALKRRFDNAVCYIYEVDPSTFIEGKTTFNGELVSEKPVKILNCKKIESIYNILLELNNQSKIILHFYQDSEEYKNIIDAHIADRIVRFNVLNHKNDIIYKFCKEHFPEILARLEEENDSINKIIK